MLAVASPPGFDHVLNPLVGRPLVKYSPKSFVNAVICFRRGFGQEGTDFTHEADGDLHAVISGAFEEKDENLKCNDFVGDGLVDQVRDEGCGGKTDVLN